MTTLLTRSEINRKYYLENREDLLIRSSNAQARKYADEETREVLKQRQRIYYQNNRESILQKAKNKRLNPPT